MHGSTNSDVGSRPGDDLDPEIRRFASEVGAAWASYPNLTAVSPPEARRIAEVVRAPWTRGGPSMAAVIEQDLSVGDGRVRVRLHHPSPDSPKPALIYLHGGGWTIFSLDTHDRVMREYAFRADVVVVGVDYALAPENTYPVALDQVTGVADALRDRGGDLGIDPERIVIGGDSAGGNLAMATCLRHRAAGRGDAVRGMLLNYPVLDRRISPEAARRFGGPGYMLSVEDMEWFWGNYLGRDVDPSDPLVSPINAELEGLPPTLLVVPECDVLTEQSLRMARLLEAAGVDVNLELYPGATHSFLEAVSVASVAAEAFDHSAAWLRALLVDE